MEKSKKILKVENLKKAYYSTSRTGEIITYPVLNNVSFEIEEGEFVGIMGRSGCGKTTLLKAVGMLDKPDEEQYITKIKIQKIYTGLNWQDLEEQRLLLYFRIIILWIVCL